MRHPREESFKRAEYAGTVCQSRGKGSGGAGRGLDPVLISREATLSEEVNKMSCDAQRDGEHEQGKRHDCQTLCLKHDGEVGKQDYGV